jgi:hypothetical protein
MNNIDRGDRHLANPPRHPKPGRLRALSGWNVGGWGDGASWPSRALQERDAAFGEHATALASLGNLEEGDAT